MAAGRKQVAEKDWRGAIETYKQAVAADDTSHAARHNIAVCYISLAEFALALENVNRALQKGGSGCAKYFSTKATILLALKRREEAVECVQTGLKLDPEYANLKSHAALSAGGSGGGGGIGGSSGGGSGSSGGSGGSGGASAGAGASHHAQGMEAVLGRTLVKKDGSSTGCAAALRPTRLTLLYFSASWCGPCRQFSPQLKAFVKANAAAQSFEVVFASLDRTQEAFMENFQGMPGAYAVPYGKGEELAATFKVAGVPSLLILCDGNVVSSKGVEGLLRDPSPPFPWVWGGAMVGRRVRVSGLAKAAHLNGKVGLCVGAVEATERYTVSVEGETAGIKATNLEVLA